MDTFIAVVKGFIYKKRKNCLALIFYRIYMAIVFYTEYFSNTRFNWL